MSEELSAEEVIAQLMAENARLRQIANDRLVYMRVLEKSVNDINQVVRATTTDINEISIAVAERNSGVEMTAMPMETAPPDETEEE